MSSTDISSRDGIGLVSRIKRRLQRSGTKADKPSEVAYP